MRILILLAACLALGACSKDEDERTVGDEIADDFNRQMDKAEAVEDQLEDANQKLEDAIEAAEDAVEEAEDAVKE